MDEYGIYGIKDDANFNANEGTVTSQQAIQKIENNATYSLTWDGFMLRTGEKNEAERIEIDSEEDIVAYDKNGKRRIKIGRLGDDSYGMRIDASNNDSSEEANKKFAYIGITNNPGSTNNNTSKAIIVA
jgi:hypothetical protein